MFEQRSATVQMVGQLEHAPDGMGLGENEAAGRRVGNRYALCLTSRIHFWTWPLSRVGTQVQMMRELVRKLAKDREGKRLHSS